MTERMSGFVCRIMKAVSSELGEANDTILMLSNTPNKRGGISAVRMNVAVTERDGLADSTATNGSRDCLLSHGVIFKVNRFPTTGQVQASYPCIQKMFLYSG